MVMRLWYSGDLTFFKYHNYAKFYAIIAPFNIT